MFSFSTVLRPRRTCRSDALGEKETKADAACDPPALGAIQSIAHSGGKQHIILVGFDTLPEEIKEIKAGNEDASVFGRAIPKKGNFKITKQI